MVKNITTLYDRGERIKKTDYSRPDLKFYESLD